MRAHQMASNPRTARRVLVVDDSAVAREVLSLVLRRDGFDVEIAPSGAVALQRIANRPPDVVVLDLEMPGMDGLQLLERIMGTAPLPVVVCSGVAQPGAAAAIRALELGAVEVIPKPAGGIRAILESGDNRVSRLVHAAASARTRRPRQAPPQEAAPVRKSPVVNAGRNGCIVVIGASTGGTEALRAILTRLPADAPPIAIVQHMPAAYTAAFAERLNALSQVEVREARDGDPLLPGVALLAPGGRHMEIVRAPGPPRVHVFSGLPVSSHQPSVDVLFRSAASLGARGVAALLTGMGADGADGMLRMRNAGAHTIAQDEATSVVFGMPGEAIVRGGAAEVAALDDIAPAILSAAARCPLSSHERHTLH